MLAMELDGYREKGKPPGFRRFARVMDIYKTYVPPAERGKGHATRLARAAFAVAQEYGYLVRPSCSYISDTFLAAKPTFKDITCRTYLCDELLLFPCCPEGRGLEERRRFLASLSAADVKARCEDAGTSKISGPKPYLIEHLLGREFGPAAAARVRCS